MAQENEINPAKRDELFSLVEDNWRPVATMTPRAQALTTERLFEVINKHVPETFTAGLLAAVLKEAGFSTVRIGNELRWLVMPR